MKLEKLHKAIAEAERFLIIAKRAEGSLLNKKYAYITGSKETAAARRASMDLTRALAELRKPN